MDPTPILGFPIMIAFLAFILWVPAEFLRKAGYSRGWTFLIFLTGYLGLIVFAFIEWPIERELAWHRFKEGNDSEANVASTEAYAVLLEKEGEWKKAENVFLELKKRARSEQSADYYTSCLRRLQERTAALEVT
jgi:hypothetical protein